MNETIYNFLENNGFELINENHSNAFGDFYKMYSNSNVLVRIISDRSQKFLDIGKKEDPGNWFYMELIRKYIEGTDKPVMTFEESIAFFINNYNIIRLMFSKEYQNTKEQLNKLILHSK